MMAAMSPFVLGLLGFSVVGFLIAVAIGLGIYSLAPRSRPAPTRPPEHDA
jgi:uncharacterized integral membrane protein